MSESRDRRYRRPRTLKRIADEAEARRDAAELASFILDLMLDREEMEDLLTAVLLSAAGRMEPAEMVDRATSVAAHADRRRAGRGKS